MHVEAGIIARCKKYDKAAFVELFKMYEKYLYKLCFSYVQNEQDALDIAQEVYIKVFKNISQFNDKMPFHPWFRTIAVNSCLNFKRASRHENEQVLEDMIAAQYDLEDEVMFNETERLIKENLEHLKPKHRMVLMLRYYEGLSYEEISAVLKEPLGTVKTDIYRARNLLKDKLRRAMKEG